MLKPRVQRNSSVDLLRPSQYIFLPSACVESPFETTVVSATGLDTRGLGHSLGVNDRELAISYSYARPLVPTTR